MVFKALYSVSWRRQRLAVRRSYVKQGLSDRNGMIASGRDTRAIRQNRWCGEALRRVSVPVDIL